MYVAGVFLVAADTHFLWTELALGLRRAVPRGINTFFSSSPFLIFCWDSLLTKPTLKPEGSSPGLAHKVGP